MDQFDQKPLQIGLIGNPNCGKTTFFNQITGIKQRVGNWPGVTVERKVGQVQSQEFKAELVDLPGTYSLAASSLDEQVARDYVLSGDAGVLINLIDASNLERSLYLTVQLLEMGLPVVVALNMVDLLEPQGINLNQELLASKLGVPVVPVVAKSGQGVLELIQAAWDTHAQGQPPASPTQYPPAMEQVIDRLVPLVVALRHDESEPLQWLAIKLLEGDLEIRKRADSSLLDQVAAMATSVELALDQTISQLVGDTRLDWISQTTTAVLELPSHGKHALSDRIDHWLLHRFFGVPAFLMAMYLVFMVSIRLSAPLIDWVDQVAGYLLVDQLGLWVHSLTGSTFLTTLIAQGVGGGVQTVLTFIPPIGLMFLCLSFLEDSGYMSRASFVLDRFIRMVGLPGRAVVPMIVGFGCTVPAAMACRTMSEERDRRLTMAMVPFMSCGAKLPVYALFSAAFFPAIGQNIVFALYLIGIAAAMGTGLLLKKAMFHGKANPLLMELPAYHMPSLGSVSATTWFKLKRFLLEAGKLIVIIITLLTLFNSFTFSGDRASSQNSVLAEVSKAITPVFYSIGITDDNWPATVGIFTGIFAKEAIIGTLDSMYSQMDQSEDADTALPSLREMITEATEKLGVGLLNAVGGWSDPLDIEQAQLSGVEEAAKVLDVQQSSFEAMRQRFDGGVGAFSYLLWVLLYAPCVAATAAIFRETDGRWVLFTVSYMTGLAWIVSTLFYQLCTFSAHPEQSLVWVSIALGLLAVLVWGIFRYAERFLKLPAEFALSPSCTHCDSDCHC